MTLDRLHLFDECEKGPWETEASTDTQWALRYEGAGHWLLVFPSSCSRRDWFQNFDLLKTPYRDMPRRWRAHRGWVKKYRSIRDALGAAIQAARPSQLTITGYSQGAALATLAFEDIQFNKGAVLPWMAVDAVVFASPRVVGWRAPAERWDGFRRIEVRGDPVVGLPFAFLGYRHVGEAEKIGPAHFPWPSRHTSYRDCLKEGCYV